MARGPVEVQAACESALAELAGAFCDSAVVGAVQEWAEVVGAAQRVLNAASAAQDAAIVRLAAIEPEFREDGTVLESHRGLGHVALDAPAVLSGVLCASAGHAERRVVTAVRLAAGGPAGSVTESGLGGLHEAMVSGRLDPYRAGVVAEELQHAPAQVAATVVAALQGYFEVEDGTHLRARCRRVLTRISPDLLHQRAARARAACGLRRWAAEPGVDAWEGTFPSEEAAQAWAAIDALAHQYVKDGVCATVERARAKALTDLVAGNATITTTLTLTVPATALNEPDTGTADGTPHPEPEAEFSGVPEPVVSGSSDLPEPDLSRTSGVLRREPVSSGVSQLREGEPVPCPANDALPETAAADTVVGDGDLVEVTGPGAGNPVLVSRQWLADTADTASVTVAQCHPGTGALLGPDSDSDSGRNRPGSAQRYRPCTGLARRVRARDRRCRFPGCSIAAVFCDLDHVRPFPAGPTTDSNLICLCRRHHRVKQRPGWTLTLTPGAVATWTDPTGKVRRTFPVDALTATVLTGPAGTTPPPSTSQARTLIPDGPHTALEYQLEHHGADLPGHRPAPAPTWRDDTGRRHCTELLPQARTVTLDLTGHWPHHRPKRPDHSHDHDPPPF